MSVSDNGVTALVDHLEKRGRMYIQPFTYDTLVAYLAGYDHARADALGMSFLDDFQSWLHHRLGHHCSLSWSAVVRDELAGGDAKKATAKLFLLLREFLGVSVSQSKRV